MTVTSEAPSWHAGGEHDDAGTEEFVVSLPYEVAEEIREKVSHQAVQEYIQNAVGRQYRDDSTARLIEDYEAGNGPFPVEVVNKAEEIWRQADERYEAWLAATKEV
ncbi:hypothetical protein [Actinorugispora endophytica]|uniref:CopG family transcriptional regulator n=1 Tax=Actinorugispora endophytica TaxID=1605990 RepID=A0A4V6PWS4_9ACTN|nr:hypothetical protein [Actinorugispora endophytica]TDQ49627.1 hypothetical protein EV190_11577 [Actinorugispora endophytica]